MRQIDTNINPYWKVINQIVKESDVVLYILDARMAEQSRNEQLEEIIEESGRPVILVVNKSDLVGKKDLEVTIDNFNKHEKREVVFVSCYRKNTIRNLISRIKHIFEKHGKREKEIYDKFTPKTIRKRREARGDIVVGVVGYPNVGKSSIINALSFKKKAKVTPKAGTTHGAHWISAGEIKLIDTPGVIPLRYVDKLKLSLIGAKGVDKIKDKDVVAGKIIEMFLEKNKLEILEKRYKTKLDKTKNAYEIIEDLGRARAHLKKGGEVDENRTNVMIIQDWQEGKIRL